MKRIFIFIFIALLTAVSVFLGVIKSNLLNASANATQKNIHMVSLLSDKAAPDILIVKVGDYVQFNSKDGNSHEMEKGHGDGYGDDHEHVDSVVGSGNFEADEAYKVQFKKEGIFDFHDHYNPKIHTTVVVNNKN